MSHPPDLDLEGPALAASPSKPASLLLRAAVLLYGVASYAIGVAALLAWIACMLGVLPFRGGPAGQLPTGPALAVDLALLVLFGLQHSVMARPAFKERWRRVLPAATERATYMLATGLVLLPVLWLWQPMEGLAWSTDNPALERVLYATQVLGWTYLFAASFAINHFELFGLEQVWRFFGGRPVEQAPFTVRWMYRFDRHPIMSGALVGLWVTPHMTYGHLLFAIGFSLYIVVGVHFEQRALQRQWGARYLEYSEQVGTLVPSLPPALPAPPDHGAAREPQRP